MSLLAQSSAQSAEAVSSGLAVWWLLVVALGLLAAGLGTAAVLYLMHTNPNAARRSDVPARVWIGLKKFLSPGPTPSLQGQAQPSERQP